MSFLYQTIFYKPLLNSLVFLYQTVACGDLGLSIIFLTTAIRLVLFPFFQKSAYHQTVMQRLQPKLKKIQEDHKHDKQKQTEETLRLYREHKVNPFFGFLFILAQLPILIALYRIFWKISSPEAMVGLYSFISAPATLDYSFLGLINLSESSILMVSLAAIAQFFQGKLGLPKTDKSETPSMAQKMGQQMVFMGPILTIVLFWKLPAALSLYWVVNSVFGIVQQIVINKKLDNGQLGKLH